MKSGLGFALLLACFFLSGFAGLVYQTAWTRQFEFVFGTSELAIATVLAAYMGGLAVGAAAAARLAHRIRRPLRAYGLLELGIALSALAVPLGLGAATSLLVALFGGQPEPPSAGGVGHGLFYVASAFAVLLVPTALMGATLPLLARHAVRRDSQVGSRVGGLYAVNTLGAVVGTCVAGFALLPALGLGRTIWVGVGANAAVFLAAVALSRAAPPMEPAPPMNPARVPANAARWILVCVLISGAVSFGYEVLWSRLLSHVLGGSVQAFSTMLASFLTGIALGSVLASRVASDPNRAARGFAWAQLGAALLTLAAFTALDRMPDLSQTIATTAGTRLAADALVAAAVLLPGALCIGATFPLAVRILARGEADAGPASARVFAWSTGGAIVGAIGTGFFLLPARGYAGAVSVGIAANLALALVVAVPRVAGWRRFALVAAAGVACWVVLPPAPPRNLLRASPMGGAPASGGLVYFGVGRSGTVLLTEQNGGWRLRTNGLAEAWIAPRGGHVAASQWLTAIATLARPEARSLLVVGLGGGVALEGVSASVESIHVVELEDEVIRANRAIAAERFRDPLSDPRVLLVVNDARGALLLTDRRYDAIVSQPSHPWTAGSSHLYTREFFELARDHLDPGGVLVQWMGARFVDEPLLQALVGTLVQVFPHVRVYQRSGALYFLASDRSLDVETRARQAIADAPAFYARLGVFGPEDLAAALMLDEAGSRAFSQGARPNTDDHNRVRMRSARYARARDEYPTHELWASLDPLVKPTPELDRVLLVRRLLARGRRARAHRVALATADPLVRALSLGWVHAAAGHSSAARDHLERALVLDPGSQEATLALLQLARRAEPPDSQRIDALAAGLRGPHRAILRGQAAVSRDDWAAVQALDAELAQLDPWDPWFEDAVRLRVGWRLAGRDPSRAREALELLDASLSANASVDDLGLRAQAAFAAGDDSGAWVTLYELAQRLRPAQGRDTIARSALDLAVAMRESGRAGPDADRLEAMLGVGLNRTGVPR